LDKFRNTKFIQKIDLDPVQQKACPIDDQDFATFLQDLFKKPRISTASEDEDLPQHFFPIDTFSLKELEIGLSSLSNLRACDDEGICSEMLKNGNEILKNEILKSFNAILRTGNIEDSWHHTIFQMLPKDDDLSKVSNWRSIAILPIRYKLFARMIYNRIAPMIFRGQSRD
jgi:hypothetical protein